MTLTLAIVDAMLRALAFAGLVAVGLTLARVRRAQVRLFAWRLVLYAALAMPVLGRALPPLSVLVPAVPALTGAALTAGHLANAAVRTDGLQVPAAAAPVVQPASATGGRWLLVTVALTYGCGVIILLFRAGLGWTITRRLERSASRINDADVIARISRHARASGLSHVPELAASDRLSVPITTSVLRPIVVLPGDWQQWSAGTLDAVLLHELSHVARRDALTQRLSLMYRALTWINPFSWWLHRRLAELGEQVGDEAALAAGIDRTTYAEALLGFLARRQTARLQGAAWHVAMARGADASAEQRLDRILAWKGNRPMKLTKILVALLVVTSAPVLVLAAAVRLELVSLRPELPNVVSTIETQLVPQVTVLPAPSRDESFSVMSAGRQPKPATKAVSTPSNVSGIALGMLNQKDNPVTIVQTTSNVTDGAYVTAVLRNDSTRVVRSVTLAAVVRPPAGPTSTFVPNSLVFMSPALGTWIPPTESRTLEPHVIDMKTLAGFPPGSRADLVVVRLEFNDGSRWTSEAASNTGVVRPVQPTNERRAYAPDTPGLVVPTMIRWVEPKYTSDAMRAKIQGTVEIEAVIRTDGLVGDMRITKSLDKTFGLDDQALAAAKQFAFTPGTLNSVPVNVVTTLLLEFRLH